MKIYRIVASQWAHSLKASGRAARWNSNKVEILYFAESRALACLENVVHRGSTDLRDGKFSLVIVQAPNYFEVLDVNKLPHGWDGIDEKAYELCRPFGDNWVRKNNTLLFKAPSVISQGDYNFLANPNHPDIKKLKIVEVVTFEFDERIKNE